jgi:hypothetical protein
MSAIEQWVNKSDRNARIVIAIAILFATVTLTALFSVAAWYYLYSTASVGSQ